MIFFQKMSLKKKVECEKRNWEFYTFERMRQIAVVVKGILDNRMRFKKEVMQQVNLGRRILFSLFWTIFGSDDLLGQTTLFS